MSGALTVAGAAPGTVRRMRALGVTIPLAGLLSLAVPGAAPAQDTGRVCERRPPPAKERPIDG
jgi:hypothetical protein